MLDHIKLLDKIFPKQKIIEYYAVENTGWSGGVSWSSTGGSKANPARFKSEQEALDYLAKTRWDDPLVLWRTVHIVTNRKNGHDKKVRWTRVK